VAFESVRTTQHATVTFVVAVAVVNVAGIVVGMLAVLLVMVVAVSVLYSKLNNKYSCGCYELKR
jgi:hypothetical protein